MPAGYSSRRRDSLIWQASIEKGQNEGLRRQNTIKKRTELSRQVSFKEVIDKLNYSGLELIRSSDDAKILKLDLIINSFTDSIRVLVQLIQKITSIGIVLKHLETRPDKAHPGELEIFVQIETKKPLLMEVLDSLVPDKIDRIEIKSTEKADNVITAEEIWIPKHVSDLDKCGHVVVKYEPTEDPKHPGFGDKDYISRRAELNAIARDWKFGDSMPDIQYLPEEHETWRIAYSKLKELRPSHTCAEYCKNIKQMEDIGLITADKIPSLQAIDKYLRAKTGFQLRPCGGLLSARDFLASLAFRVFQTTLYLRHHSKPNHCPEPDLIHEILGHTPMFADPVVAEFSQEVGLLSIGASDEQIERLATLYWFIIEFGLCEENGKLKAIGAGLISAFGELQHAISDTPEHAPFDPYKTAIQKYEDSDYQPLYFVAKSMSDAMEKLRKYALDFDRSAINVYNPFSQTISQLSHEDYAKKNMKAVNEDIHRLSEIIQACKIQKM
uniref:Biopterin-dependent aromatic amino acid hydroxylase family profile domain-containing protein n=1 Tax=Panagrolaimus davidi TaxID=227884 RepID=A0A914QAI2_9BILA